MMQNEHYIEFKKERDLGAMITDAFQFIRENWKEFFMTILKIVGPVLIVALVAMIGYFYAISDLFKGFGNNNTNPSQFLSGFLPWVGVLILAYVLLYTLLSMTSLYFIKSYIDNKGKASYEEVKQNVLQNFWKFIGLGLLIAITVFFGFILCYIPGIWLYIVLSLATSIMVFEKKDVMDTFSHSFTLIKGEWWNTFGVKIVIGLIIGVLSQVFAVPAFIYQMIQMFTSASHNDPTQMLSLFKDPIYLALNILSYTFQFILSAITMITGAFIYFDLNEKKNLTGAIERIDELGNDHYIK